MYGVIEVQYLVYKCKVSCKGVVKVDVWDSKSTTISLETLERFVWLVQASNFG